MKRTPVQQAAAKMWAQETARERLLPRSATWKEWITKVANVGYFSARAPNFLDGSEFSPFLLFFVFFLLFFIIPLSISLNFSQIFFWGLFLQ
jgi:hypothetical protein